MGVSVEHLWPGRPCRLRCAKGVPGKVSSPRWLLLFTMHLIDYKEICGSLQKCPGLASGKKLPESSFESASLLIATVDPGGSALGAEPPSSTNGMSFGCGTQRLRQRERSVELPVCRSLVRTV